MKGKTVRDRLLLAFAGTEEKLTRRELLARAKTTDIHELRHLVDADHIHKDWAPKRENVYSLTQHGYVFRSQI